MDGAKHTPGPWVLEYFGADGIEELDAKTVIASYEGRHNEDGEAIAEVFRWSAGNNPPDPEAQANADLIAAAPDLLAALEACELAMDTAAQSGVGDILAPAYRESWSAAHTKAQQLLAQLKGG